MKDDERLVIPFSIPKTKEMVTISASAKKKKKKKWDYKLLSPRN